MVVFRRIYQNDRGIWQVEFERDGRLLYFSLRTRLEAVAEAKAEQYRRGLALAEYHDRLATDFGEDRPEK
jgi:hypothetical protein